MQDEGSRSHEAGRAGAGRPVIVIGGTGMLRPAVHALAQRGSTVVAVARRPHRAAPPEDAPGAFVPVTGEWSRPEQLVAAIRAALDDRDIPPEEVAGAVVWVHTPHRQAVLDELERLLPGDASVLQLWGSAAQDPREVHAAEHGRRRPWRERHVFLGYEHDGRGPRWLTSEEISSGVLEAWERSDEQSADGAGRQAVVGRIDPWEERP